MQMAIALVTLALCGGFLWWFRRSENRRSFKRSEEESAERERKAQETAQEFVNARDLGENCLYTNDGYIFAYLKVDGVCLELLSRQEQKALCRQVSAALSLVRRPYKFSGVSRPADISKSLQKYSELAEQAVGGRKSSCCPTRGTLRTWLFPAKPRSACTILRFGTAFRKRTSAESPQRRRISQRSSANAE